MVGELGILVFCFPLLFATFNVFSRTRTLFLVFALSLACLFDVYLIFLKFTPETWIPLLSYGFIWILEAFAVRKISFLKLLSGLITVCALLATDLKVIVLLVSFADGLLCLEAGLNNSRQYREIARAFLVACFTVVPIYVAILLGFEGNLLKAALMTTIVLRSVSWPVETWWKELQLSPGVSTITSAVVWSFILWRTQATGFEPLWAITILILFSVLSVGSASAQLIWGISFGLMNLSPKLGLVSVATWPLLFFEGINLYVGYFFTAVAGYLLCGSLKDVFVPEAGYAIAGFSAILCARRFVDFKANENKKLPLLAIGFVIMVLAVVLFIFPETFPITQQPIEVTFVSVFFFALLLGFALKKRRPSWFKSVRAISILDVFPIQYVSAPRGFDNRLDNGEPAQNWTSTVFDLWEADYVLIVLLGFVGVVLILGRLS